MSVPSVVCDTTIDFTPFSFHWRIRHLPAHLIKAGDFLESLSFEVGSRRLYMVAKRKSKDGEDWLCIYLRLKEGADVSASFSISLIPDGPQKHLVLTGFPKVFFVGSPSRAYKCIRFADLYGNKNQHYDDVVRNLSIRVEGRIYGETLSEMIHDEEKNSAEDIDMQSRMLAGLSSDLGLKLFESSKFSDFTIKAENTEFRVHKPILAARSDFFAALFESGMRETSINEIVADDVGIEALQEFVRFIYTGKVEDFEGFELKLLHAADKYQVAGLKEIVERVLCATLTTENAFELLVYADRYSAKLLKARTIEFIDCNHEGVVKSAGYCQHFHEHPRLIAELFVSAPGNRKRRASKMSNRL